MVRNLEVFSKILEKYSMEFTDAEKRIADYILKHPHETVTFSVTSLAEKAGTSQATVVRFARALGFKGFLELKNELLKRASRELAFPNRREKKLETKANSVEYLVGEAEIANIHETVANLDPKELDAFVQLLIRAKVIYTAGSGMSSFLCRLAAYQLTLIGKRSVALPDSASSFEEQLALAAPTEDLLWVFSFPPYSGNIIHTVEFARKAKIPVVAITDRKTSPVVDHVAAFLTASNNNVLPTNSIASSLVIITSLLVKVAQGRPATKYAEDLAQAVGAVLT